MHLICVFQRHKSSKKISLVLRRRPSCFLKPGLCRRKIRVASSLQRRQPLGNPSTAGACANVVAELALGAVRASGSFGGVGNSPRIFSAELGVSWQQAAWPVAQIV